MSRSAPASARALDLLGKGLARLLGLDAAERRQAHAQRADIAGNAARRWKEAMITRRASSTPARLISPTLLLQAVLRQLVAVGAEGVGLDDLRRRPRYKRGGFPPPAPAGSG